MEPSTAATCSSAAGDVTPVDAPSSASQQLEHAKQLDDDVSVVDSLAPTPPAVLVDDAAIRADRERRIVATIEDVLARVNAQYEMDQQHIGLVQQHQLLADTAPFACPQFGYQGGCPSRAHTPQAPRSSRSTRRTSTRPASRRRAARTTSCPRTSWRTSAR